MPEHHSDGAASSSSDERPIHVVSHSTTGVSEPSSSSFSRGNRPHSGSAASSLTNGRPASLSSRTEIEMKDDEDAMSTGPEEETQEHQYHRGRQAVPMQSPGEEAEPDLTGGEDDESTTTNHQRLPRLRNRVFFQGDDLSRSSSGRYRSGDRILRNITFRRRKKHGEYDFFWTSIFIANVMSLAVLSCLVIYLSQTDFFAEHQGELFGTTVDNRFTVVSQEDAGAKIFLKSGHSNSRYSEAMLAFEDGTLRVGRRALSPTDEQSFYGLSLFNNGTTVFTNKVNVPTIASEYIHAGKAVIFDDGTVMTTAANMSGGISEDGDLNLVSRTGSVTTSAGGKPVLLVSPEGTVAMISADAEDPVAMGITIDGTESRISIASAMHFHHGVNASHISTMHPLVLNTSEVLFGGTDNVKVTISVPGMAGVNLNDQGESEDDDNEDKSTTLELIGQTSETQQQGGDIRISGGSGLDTGGDVIISGGKATNSSSNDLGTVLINANLNRSASSTTEIGTHSASHEVNIHGKVSLNSHSKADNATQVTVAGGLFQVQSQKIAINNTATIGSKLNLDSNNLRIGPSSSSLHLGGISQTNVTLHGNKTVIDASKSVAIGPSASLVTIGHTELAGQAIKLRSESINIDASNGLEINSQNADSSTIIYGNAVLGATSKGTSTQGNVAKTNVTISGTSLGITSQSIRIGATTSSVTMVSKTVSIDATQEISIGETSTDISIGNEATEVTIGDTTTISSKLVEIVSTNIALGGDSTTAITLGTSNVKNVVFDGQNIDIGSEAASISIGSSSPIVNVGSASGVINLQGTVTLNGDNLEARRRLAESENRFGYLNADQISISFNGTKTEFPLQFQDSYLSVPTLYHINESKESFTTQANEGGYIQLAFNVNSIRLKLDSSVAPVSSQSKIRCRVYQLKHASTELSTVLETVGVVDHCSGVDCDDGFFTSLSTQRIANYSLHDTFAPHCTLDGSDTGKLLMDGVQFSFVEL